MRGLREMVDRGYGPRAATEVLANKNAAPNAIFACAISDRLDETTGKFKKVESRKSG